MGKTSWLSEWCVVGRRGRGRAEQTQQRRSERIRQVANSITKEVDGFVYSMLERQFVKCRRDEHSGRESLDGRSEFRLGQARNE